MYMRDVAKRGDRHNMGFGTPYNVFRSEDMPSDDTEIARYVTRTTLIDMVTAGLSFTRLDQFHDPLDGAFPENQKLTGPFYDDLRDNAHLRTRLAASCWTLIRDRSESVYGHIDRNGGPSRVCGVHTTIGALCRALDWTSDVQFDDTQFRSPILYCDTRRMNVFGSGLYMRMFFWKSLKYKKELEYRFLYSPYDLTEFTLTNLKIAERRFPLKPRISERIWRPLRWSKDEFRVSIRRSASRDEELYIRRLCGRYGISILPTRKNWFGLGT